MDGLHTCKSLWWSSRTGGVKARLVYSNSKSRVCASFFPVIQYCLINFPRDAKITNACHAHHVGYMRHCMMNSTMLMVCSQLLPMAFLRLDRLLGPSSLDRIHGHSATSSHPLNVFPFSYLVLGPWTGVLCCAVLCCALRVVR